MGLKTPLGVPINIYIYIYIFSNATTCSLRLRVLRHPPTTFPLQSVLTQAVYRQATKTSHREWQYHMLHVHNCILLKMSTWGSKHVEENIILWINNNQCIKLVVNIQSIHDARSEKHCFARWTFDFVWKWHISVCLFGLHLSTCKWKLYCYYRVLF